MQNKGLIINIISIYIYILICLGVMRAAEIVAQAAPDAEMGQEEEKQEQTEMIMEAAEVTVTTAAELKAELTAGTGAEIIYLGADIQIPADGIFVNRSRGSFIIDGTDPQTGEIHILSDAQTDSASGTIRLDQESHTSDLIVLRNLIIEGANHYGTVSYADAASYNRTILYQNVSYTGPQLTFIPYGTAVYDNVDITIAAAASPAGEVAELSQAVFCNNVTIDQKGTNGNAFFFTRSSNRSVDAKILVESGAQVSVTAAAGNTNSSFLYNEASSLEVVYAEDSSFLFDGQGQYNRNVMITNMRVESGASVQILASAGLSEQQIRMNGDLYIGEGSVFRAENHTGSTNRVLYFASGSLVAEEPAQMLLYSNGGGLIRRARADSQVEITAQQLNLWTTVSSGGFTEAEAPVYSWMKADGSPVELAASGMQDEKFTTVTSNYTSRDPSSDLLVYGVYTVPSADSFQVHDARIISCGYLQEVTGIYESQEELVHGKASPAARIMISESDEHKQRQKVIGTGEADAVGNYVISPVVPDAEWTDMRVQSCHDYLFSAKTELSLSAGLSLQVPEVISLQTGTISGKVERLPFAREDSSFHVQVLDGRWNPGPWKLTVSAAAFTADSQSNGTTETLSRGIIYVDEKGQAHDLQTEYLLGSSDGGSMYYEWEEGYGFMAEADTNEVLPGMTYQTELVWNLSETP